MKKNARMRTRASRAPSTPERDLILLEEYGFDPRTMTSSSHNEDIIKRLNMRQLDRLKMLILRSVPYSDGSISEELKQGVKRNDQASFAAALTFIPSKLSTPREKRID